MPSFSSLSLHALTLRHAAAQLNSSRSIPSYEECTRIKRVPHLLRRWLFEFWNERTRRLSDPIERDATWSRLSRGEKCSPSGKNEAPIYHRVLGWHQWSLMTSQRKFILDSRLSSLSSTDDAVWPKLEFSNRGQIDRLLSLWLSYKIPIGFFFLPSLSIFSSSRWMVPIRTRAIMTDPVSLFETKVNVQRTRGKRKRADFSTIRSLVVRRRSTERGR